LPIAKTEFQFRISDCELRISYRISILNPYLQRSYLLHLLYEPTRVDNLSMTVNQPIVDSAQPLPTQKWQFEIPLRNPQSINRHSVTTSFTIAADDFAAQKLLFGAASGANNRCHSQHAAASFNH
jgi:hypothetical protein